MSSSGSVYVNGKPITTEGDLVSPDANCDDGNPHCAPVTANGSGSVYAEGSAVIRKGDPDTCGDPRGPGSPDVNAGG